MSFWGAAKAPSAELKQTYKSENEFYEHVLEFISHVPLFQQIPPDHLPTVAKAFEERDYSDGENINTQGVPGNEFFVIKKGEATVFVDNHEVSLLGRFDFFGEGAMLHGTPHRHTVTAKGNVECLALTRQSFNNLHLRKELSFQRRKAMVHQDFLDSDRFVPEKNEQEKEFIKKAFMSDSFVGDYFKDCKVLSSVLEEITDAAFSEKVAKNTVLFTQGDIQADLFYMLQSGTAEVFKDGVKIASYKDSGSFGGQALVLQTPRVLTVEITSDSKVWCIPRSALRHVLQQQVKDKVARYKKVLDKVELFDGWSHEDKELLADALLETTYNKGQVVTKEGEDPKSFFILEEGEVSEVEHGVKHSSIKAEGINCEHLPYFGEKAVQEDHTYYCTRKVVSDTATFLVLRREVCQRVLQRHVLEHAHYTDRIEYTMSELSTEHLLGCGGFGKVTLEKCASTGRMYALKKISKGWVVESQHTKQIMNEKRILHMCHSHFLVQCAATFNTEQYLYFLLEPVLGGDLYHIYAVHDFHGRADLAQFYSACVIKGFEHLHDRSVIYRDMKQENLLLDTKGYCKITDFGLSKFCIGKTFTICGTPEFFAPEMIKSLGHTIALDWWTLGILIYEFMMGGPPFHAKDIATLAPKILKGMDSCHLPHCRSCAHLIKDLCKNQPGERLPVKPGGFKKLENHEWYTEAGFDFNALAHRQLTAPFIPKEADRGHYFDDAQEDPEVRHFTDIGDGWDEEFEDALGPRDFDDFEEEDHEVLQNGVKTEKEKKKKKVAPSNQENEAYYVMKKKDKNNRAVHADSLRVQKKIARFGNRTSVQHAEVVMKKAPRHPQVPSVLAGAVHGLVVLMSFTSFAFLIFGNSDHEELQAVLPLAISQQVLSAFVLIGLLTFSGHFPFTMGGPTPPAALLVAEVVRAAVDTVEDPDKKVPTAFLVIGLCSIMMGLVLVLLGITGTASYAQQLPYPVMCGFLGSVGLLLSRNAVQILLDVRLRWIFVPVSFEDAAKIDLPIALTQMCLGLAVCLLLIFGVPRISAFVQKRGFKATPILPSAFILPLVGFFAVAGLSGMDFGAEGTLRKVNPSWLFAKIETKAFWTFWGEAYAVDRWDLEAVASALPNMVIASILCVLSALINMSGIENLAPQPKVLNLDSEFFMLGKACLVTGALAGHPGHHVAAFTLPMKKDGGLTRLAPWTASFIWCIVFFTSAPISSFVPRFFMGGCFLQIGIGLARTFLWDNRKSMDMVSKLIALLMVLVSLFTNLNYAAGFGFVLVCLNFIRLSEGIDVVQSATRLDMFRSPKQRRMEEVKLLSKYGHRVMMLHLHGYLFWGTVDKIFDTFDGIINGTPDDPEEIYVVLEQVSGIEVSVIGAFRKLHRIAKNVGINIVLCGFPGVAVLGQQVDTLLRSLPFANAKPFVDLLEESEDKLLAAVSGESQKVCIVNPLTSLQLQLRERRTLAKQRILEGYANATGSVYAIRWESVDGVLHLGQTYNSNERILYLVKAALPNQTRVQSFVTHSALVSPSCDSPDVLCQSWRRQRALLCRDVSQSTEELFPRRRAAQKFDIKRVVFLPTADGVYEFGAVNADGSSRVIDVDTLVTELDIPALPELDAERFARAVVPSVCSAPILDVDQCPIEISMEAITEPAKPPVDQFPIEINKQAITDASEIPAAVSTLSPDTKNKDECLDRLQKYLSESLLLSLFTLCDQQLFKAGDKLVPDELMANDADFMFIIVDGAFGTFDKHVDAVGDEDGTRPGDLVLKAGPGAILGANDMFLQRPWSVKIVCLSEAGTVLSLSSEVVRQLENYETPFANLETSEEFSEYLKSQMALQDMTLSCRATSN